MLTDGGEDCWTRLPDFHLVEVAGLLFVFIYVALRTFLFAFYKMFGLYFPRICQRLFYLNAMHLAGRQRSSINDTNKNLVLYTNVFYMDYLQIRILLEFTLFCQLFIPPRFGYAGC